MWCCSVNNDRTLYGGNPKASPSSLARRPQIQLWEFARFLSLTRLQTPYIMKNDNTREPSHLFPPSRKRNRARLMNHTHNDGPQAKESKPQLRGNAKPSQRFRPDRSRSALTVTPRREEKKEARAANMIARCDKAHEKPTPRQISSLGVALEASRCVVQQLSSFPFSLAIHASRFTNLVRPPPLTR